LRLAGFREYKVMTTSKFALKPVDVSIVLKDKVYESLKSAIMSMDIYGDEEPPRLDERRLAEELGVSRTPVREAISRLEQEGLVQSIPRRGAFVVRKSKEEILQIICVWAALESMAARLATQRATDRQIAGFRDAFVTSDDADQAGARIDEYSERNIRFHQNIIALSGCDLLAEMAEGLFIHMRHIRARTIKDADRADRSIIDHLHIIEALEARDTELAERLVREHTLALGEHVKKYVDYLG
jgi:DNA-binding GntR family transcriptional regulator